MRLTPDRLRASAPARELHAGHESKEARITGPLRASASRHYFFLAAFFAPFLAAFFVAFLAAFLVAFLAAFFAMVNGFDAKPSIVLFVYASWRVNVAHRHLLKSWRPSSCDPIAVRMR